MLEEVRNCTAGHSAPSTAVVVDQGTGLAVRLYRPSSRRGRLPVLLYFHGGAFVIMTPFEPKYHDYLNALVARARVVAVSVDYRLAPEHPLPAAYDASWAALNWAARNAAAETEPSIRDKEKDLGVESSGEAQTPGGRATSDRQRRRTCASASAAVEEDKGNDRQGRERRGTSTSWERKISANRYASSLGGGKRE